MASIRTEILIDVSPDDVWVALRDWGALHKRLAPGFVTDVQLDDDDRIVTFFDGSVVRERLVDLDNEARRLAWTMVEGPYSHHNGYAQVFPTGTVAPALSGSLTSCPTTSPRVPRSSWNKGRA